MMDFTSIIIWVHLIICFPFFTLYINTWIHEIGHYLIIKLYSRNKYKDITIYIKGTNGITNSQYYQDLEKRLITDKSLKIKFEVILNACMGFVFNILFFICIGLIWFKLIRNNFQGLSAFTLLYVITEISLILNYIFSIIGSNDFKYIIKPTTFKQCKEIYPNKGLRSFLFCYLFPVLLGLGYFLYLIYNQT